MLSMLLCYDNVLTSVDIQHMQGTHINTIIMKILKKNWLKQNKVIVLRENKTKK